MDEVAVEKFLMDIGEVSLKTAYGNLRYGRKLHRWSPLTSGAISDGILVASTNRNEGVREEEILNFIVDYF